MPKNKIAVEPLFDPDMTASGLLYIPDQAKERCDQGLVKYIGKGCEDEFEIGDHVLFSGYAGTLVRLQGEGLLIILSKRFVTAKIAKQESLDVEGLYFIDRDGEYFPASYEQATALMARALETVTPIRPSNKSWTAKRDGSKLTEEDYEDEDE
jgi:co-chaperonin GroES (HSP10)